MPLGGGEGGGGCWWVGPPKRRGSGATQPQNIGLMRSNPVGKDLLEWSDCAGRGGRGWGFGFALYEIAHRRCQICKQTIREL